MSESPRVTQSGRLVELARKRLRTSGYSQAVLADMLEISPSQLSQWLRYRWNPTAENLEKIASVLGFEWTSWPPPAGYEIGGKISRG